MVGHQRVKDIDYDDDDLYDESEDTYAEDEAGEEGYTAEDRGNFNTLTPVVRAELEEAGLQASDREVQDALWHYYWDVAKSVGYLKNVKKPKQQQQQQPARKQEKEKVLSRFDQAAEKSKKVDHAGSDKSKQQANGLAKKTEALKLDSNPAPPPQPKVRSKGLNVPMKWAEMTSSRKASAAFVVIGHVDHGKSTLMGRLLLDTGAVSQRDIDRFKKQAADIGKSSFALAWVMDTGSEERERGVTVDIAQHHFSTDKTDFTILDAPGHRDFVPNMIGGASMANLTVLVVDANQLESGMKGQTKEHIQLAQAVGLEKIVVAVNKLDTTNPPWNQDTFQTVKTEVSKFLTEIGFPESDVTFVPCSGLGGENVANPASVDWVKQNHQTLLQHLEQSPARQPTEALLKRPFRLQITDVFRGGVQNPLSVSGLITAGSAQVGDVFTVQPGGEMATIKGIEVAADGRDWAVAGEICNLHLADIEAQHLRSGDMLCSSSQPVAVVKSFTTKVQAIDALLPQSLDVHIGRLHVPGSIAQLVATVGWNGEVLKKKPRVVKAGSMAVIKVALEEGAPVEDGDRVVLRAGGSTVAAGVVE